MTGKKRIDLEIHQLVARWPENDQRELERVGDDLFKKGVRPIETSAGDDIAGKCANPEDDPKWGGVNKAFDGTTVQMSDVNPATLGQMPSQHTPWAVRARVLEIYSRSSTPAGDRDKSAERGFEMSS